VRNRIEVLLEVRIDDPDVSGLQQAFDLLQGIKGAMLRSKPVALSGKLPLKDWFQHRS